MIILLIAWHYPECRRGWSALRVLVVEDEGPIFTPSRRPAALQGTFPEYPGWVGMRSGLEQEAQ